MSTVSKIRPAVPATDPDAAGGRTKRCLVASCEVEPDVGLEHCWRHRTHQVSASPPSPAPVKPKVLAPGPAVAAPALRVHASDPEAPAKRCQAVGGCEKTFPAAGARRYCDEHRWVKGMERAPGALPNKSPEEKGVISMPAKVHPIVTETVGGGTARKSYTRKPKDQSVTAIADLVSNARAILDAAPNLERVKLAFVMQRDGSIVVENIAFSTSAQAGER